MEIYFICQFSSLYTFCCFYFLPIIINTAVSIYVQVFVWTYVFILGVGHKPEWDDYVIF